MFCSRLYKFWVSKVESTVDQYKVLVQPIGLFGRYLFKEFEFFPIHLVHILCCFDTNYKSYYYPCILKSTQSLIAFSQIPKSHPSSFSPIISQIQKSKVRVPNSKSQFSNISFNFDHQGI